MPSEDTEINLVSICALVDYDGWLHHERWGLSESEAKRKAMQLVSDEDSRVIKIQLLRGSYTVWSRTNWKKQYSCNI